MGLPSAEELRAIFAAAREHGVTHLRSGGLEVRFSPVAPAPVQTEGEALVAAVMRQAPLPRDPIDVVKNGAADAQRRVIRDPLEVLAAGGRLLDQDSADPTQAS